MCLENMIMLRMSSFNLLAALSIFAVLVIQITTTEACRGGRIVGTGVTAAEKYQILEVHNRLRSQVAQGQVPNQPSAQNMQEMVWDEELAARAQQWAHECIFEHDPSRYTNRFTMGQNLAIIWSTAPLGANEGDFPSRIQNWFNEVQKYAWGSSWSPATGHYSQLVWGDTNLVGCGFSYYQDSRRFNKLYVCNYGPGGNVVGSNPYAVGAPSCSSYGMYPSSRYSGLCVSTQTYYAPQNNNYYTQDTYTFKSERVNPTVYQTYRKTPAYSSNSYRQNNAASTYQNALQTYQSPHTSYYDAQQSYQQLLQAYAAYSQPQSRSPYYNYVTTGRSNYDWRSYFGK